MPKSKSFSTMERKKIMIKIQRKSCHNGATSNVNVKKKAFRGLNEIKNAPDTAAGKAVKLPERTDKEIFAELTKETKKAHDHYRKMFQEGKITSSQMGPAVAGVYNKRLDKFYFAKNSNGSLPEVMHPYIMDRIMDMPDEVSNGYSKTKRAGSHAECFALNDSLLDDLCEKNSLDREFLTQEEVDAVTENETGTPDLDNNYVCVMNLKKFEPHLPETGTKMPRCYHCQYITHEAKADPEMQVKETESNKIHGLRSIEEIESERRKK